MAALMVCASTAPAAGFWPRPTGPSTRALLVGDSLATGASGPLHRLLDGWSIHTHARIGRGTAEGMRVLAHLRRHGIPPVVVISLGTNDDPASYRAFGRAVDSVLARVGPWRCVVWTSISRPPYRGHGYTRFNRVLRTYSSSTGNLKVVDWHGMVARGAVPMARDHVHPGPGGYQKLAEAIATAVRGCTSWSAF
jgi:lysophospholipase L1-like esterase